MVKGVHGERGGMGGEGGEHGRGYAWMVGAYIVGGVCGRGMHGRACMAGGAYVHDRRPPKMAVRLLLECILVN